MLMRGEKALGGLFSLPTLCCARCVAPLWFNRRTEDRLLQKEAFGHHENGCHRRCLQIASGSRGMRRPRRTTWHELPETCALGQCRRHTAFEVVSIIAYTTFHGWTLFHTDKTAVL